jgi:patatin-like phospholipase/acyl hydrolase
MKKILSIDGGGIRGIIPAMILADIEQRTGRPIAELFDLIAGTSAGGIIALGLAKPNGKERPQYAAQDMVGLFEDEGPKIFEQSLWRKINNLGSLLDEKYPSHNMEAVLSRYFDSRYLADAITPLLITSYEIERRNPLFFKSAKATKDKGRNFLMKDVARATSAAPTYFEPEKIPTEDQSEYYALIDGGIFANNPAMCAFVEAKTMWPDENDFLLVSLGTGDATEPIYYQQAVDWGMANWARPILSVVFDGVNDTVDYQLQQLLPAVDQSPRYYRFQVRLDKASDALDNDKPLNIRALKLYAENLLRDQAETVAQLCEQLK